MSWKAAFLAQAGSDNRVRHLLETTRAEHCHRLHYLQMASEKLAKGLLADARDPEPPPPTHTAFVRLLQTLKGRPDLRRRLGMGDAALFKAYVDSLLDLAARIEALAPSAAGFTRPNPEYPWRDSTTGVVIAPATFHFPAFDPRDARMVKLERLIEKLFRLAN